MFMAELIIFFSVLKNRHKYHTTLQTLIKKTDPHSFNESRIFLIAKTNTTIAKQNNLDLYPYANSYTGPKRKGLNPGTGKYDDVL